MSGDMKTALLRRRSYYNITSKSPVSDSEIQEIVNFAVLNTPSAFNSQSSRVVLLFGGGHKKLWEIVRSALRKIVPADKFAPTDGKVNSFAAGHGTVLFFEDQAAIRGLQKDFPLYADAFPGYSENSAGMLQLVVWTMLQDAGLGASLQHYGNLIHADVRKEWSLPADWKPIAQMPFGVPEGEPGVKEFMPIEERVKVFS